MAIQYPCATCIFFAQRDEVTICRFAPPVMKYFKEGKTDGFLPVWPIVEPNDGCGQHHSDASPKEVEPDESDR